MPIKPVPVGDMRDRVELYDVPETTRSTYGQPSTLGTYIGTFAAYIEPLSVRPNEFIASRQAGAIATHMVRMQWLGSAIPPSPGNPKGLIIERMKLKDLFDDSILNIIDASFDRLNRQWILMCKKRSGAIS